MSYCRFENTLRDLRDCIDHLDDELTDEESNARFKLMILCAEIAKGLNRLIEEYPELLDPKA